MRDKCTYEVRLVWKIWMYLWNRTDWYERYESTYEIRLGDMRYECTYEIRLSDMRYKCTYEIRLIWGIKMYLWNKNEWYERWMDKWNKTDWYEDMNVPMKWEWLIWRYESTYEIRLIDMKIWIYLWSKTDWYDRWMDMKWDSDMKD